MQEPIDREPARANGRGSGVLRPVRMVLGVSPYAEGSAEVAFGNTQLLVTASVEKEVPQWLAGGSRGWITAEYGMLPRATSTRNKREAASGRQTGRTQEIQRLVGRALRSAVHLEELSGLTIRVDCDVLTADGGTRTAAICGGWLALRQALDWAYKHERLSAPVSMRRIAAISAGVVNGVPLLDLDYSEDSTADFDLNVVMDESLRLVEVQGTAEAGAISNSDFMQLLDLCQQGIERILAMQQQALAEANSTYRSGS